MSAQATALTPALYEYMLQVSLHDPLVTQELWQATMSLPGSEMILRPEQGQLLAFLVKLIQAKNTLDIGTFTGYSALWVALALPPEGKVITCDISDQMMKTAQQYWEKANVNQKIDFRLGPALETLDTLLAENKTFDFVFIDADKVNNWHYFEKSLQLLRSNGLIAIDNIFQGGKVVNSNDTKNATKAVRDFNTRLFSDSRVDISLIPLGDGLTLARKK